MSYSNPEHNSGFSLIELILAMLIGVVIMGGVMQVYDSTRKTHRSSEDQLNLLANARFAMDTIAHDLRHTGLWGRNNNYQSIGCQKSDAEFVSSCPAAYAMPAATSDCDIEEYINLERPLFATDNNNPYGSTCAAESYKTGTDVLSLRYADSSRLDSGVLSAGVAYVRSNFRAGMVFLGPDVPPKSDVPIYKWDDNDVTFNHLLVSRTYYVSDYTDSEGDGLPSLRRVDLVQGPSLESDVLLAGVEDFQLEFGIDTGEGGVLGTDKDGQVNSFVDAGSVTNTLAENGWSNGEVVAVRIWLLMRSEREDRDKIGGSQTFIIAGNTVTTADDGYRRYLMSSVVKLRNTHQEDLKKLGGN